VHVAAALIVRFWSEDPGIPPQQANVRLLKIKEGEAYPV
jgi:hypothetical protein